MNILIIRRSNDNYLDRLKKIIYDLGYNIYILDMPNRKLIHNDKILVQKERRFRYNKAIEIILRVLFGLKLLIFSKIDYDVVHILSWKTEKVFLFPFLNKSAKKIINIYGTGDIKRNLNSFFLNFFSKNIDNLVFSNTGFYSRYKDYFNNNLQKKVKIILLPLQALEFIDKNRNTILKDHVIINCCQRTAVTEQHERIINELKKLYLSADFEFTFQMTYKVMDDSINEYISRIIGLVRSNLGHLSVSIYTEFFTFHDLANFRLMQDIFINLKLEDQFSGAMLEALFAGSYVIVGSWLRYEDLDNLGIFYKKIKSFSELNEAILEAINYLTHSNKVELAENINIIRENYLPENLKKMYNEIYSF